MRFHRLHLPKRLYVKQFKVYAAVIKMRPVAELGFEIWNEGFVVCLLGIGYPLSQILKKPRKEKWRIKLAILGTYIHVYYSFLDAVVTKKYPCKQSSKKLIMFPFWCHKKFTFVCASAATSIACIVQLFFHQTETGCHSGSGSRFPQKPINHRVNFFREFGPFTLTLLHCSWPRSMTPPHAKACFGLASVAWMKMK